jgi:hypothetical protein
MIVREPELPPEETAPFESVLEKDADIQDRSTHAQLKCSIEHI